MDDSQGPSSIIEQILRDRSTEDNEEALYQYMLEACEKLFMNELDQATFEEHMRWFFGTKVCGRRLTCDQPGVGHVTYVDLTQAFLLYTVDKIVASLIKQVGIAFFLFRSRTGSKFRHGVAAYLFIFAFQVQTIVSDNKCQELWQFLRRHRSEVSFTRQDIIKYRRKAEQHVGADDNLYRVEWVRVLLLRYFWDRTDRDMNAETRGQIVACPADGIGGGERRRRPYVCEPMEGVRRLVCYGISHGMDPGCGAWSATPFVCPQVWLD